MEERTEKVRTAIEESDFDAVVVVSYAGFQYLTGYWYQYGRSFPYRPSIVVWAKGQEPIILVGRDQVAGPERDSWITDVRSYDQSGRRPPGGVTEELAAVLREVGVDEAVIGIEFGSMHVALHQELLRELPNAEFVDCDGFFDDLRAIKSADEIATMRRCAAAVEQGIMAAFRSARPGWTEKQLHDAICTEALARGAGTIVLVTVQSGKAASGFYPTSENVMEGYVRTDATAIVNGYFADMARMAFIGEPSAEQDATFQRQLELNARIIDSMQAGAPASAVFERAESAAASLGAELLEQPNIGIGHTIGLNSQDWPALKASEPAELEPGMIFAIEPDTIGPAGELMHVEEMVLIGADGPDVITSTEDWSELFRIR
ncbi:MAG: Xaa-Pro peptidase family protein [Solirubrobacterales bacterium]